MASLRRPRVGSLAERGPAVIGPGQRKLHVASEAFAVIVGVPWLISLALRKKPKLTNFDKGFAFFMAMGTLLVDGGLLVTWLKPRKKKTKISGALRAAGMTPLVTTAEPMPEPRPEPELELLAQVAGSAEHEVPAR